MAEEETLKNKIYAWLETQGYTTEMKVAMSLHNAGFGVLKSHYYDDPEAKISREIDVVSMIHDQLGLLEVYSVIECKKSQKPWILFSSEFGGTKQVYFICDNGGSNIGINKKQN